MEDTIDGWKKACDLLGKEIGERLLIWVTDLRDCFKQSAGNPRVTLKMTPADAGDMPLVTISLSIPKIGVKDFSELDLNQLRLFERENE